MFLEEKKELCDTIFIFILLLEKEEEFDWGKYLMEGEEIYFGPVDTPVSNFLR